MIQNDLDILKKHSTDVADKQVNFNSIFEKNGRTIQILKILRQIKNNVKEDSEIDLKRADYLVKENEKYYLQKYGKHLCRLPEEFENNTDYGASDIINNLACLEIKPQEYFLFFYGIIYQQIDLPPLWE
jgi:tRNA A22 N-methylase